MSLALTAGEQVLAHGVGAREDLPIALELAVAGAVAALVGSFTVLALAWHRPRYETPRRGRALPTLTSVVDSLPFTLLVRGFGLAAFGYTAMVAVFGQDLLTNPIFGIFYVLLWVGVPFASAFVGPFYRAISPVRTINLAFCRISGTDPEVGMRDYPARLGYWPAALGLLGFVWLELVAKSGDELPSVRLWLAIYVAAMIIGAAVYGEEWFERADPFEVYSTLIGKLSVWFRNEDGHIAARSPLANLATVEVRPGLVAVVGVLFGSTVFDSFGESPMWLDFIQATSINGYLLNNLALLAFCAGATFLFWVACLAAGLSGVSTPAEPAEGSPSLGDRFAHSIVPIILGYIVAHYLTYFVEAGQRTVTQLSDPFSTGANYFGTADWTIWFGLSIRQSLVANIKVIAVVVGHVLGAIAAHDRAVALLPERTRLTGQLPLLAIMVGFTAGGLFLLFAS